MRKYSYVCCYCVGPGSLRAHVDIELYCFYGIPVKDDTVEGERL
jgi:hypothetical protein